MTAHLPLAMATVATLYRWRDASGAEHLADGLSEVPKAFRESAVQVEGGVSVEQRGGIREVGEELGVGVQRVENAANRALAKAEQAVAGKASGSRVHLPSIALGVGLVVLLALVASLLRKRPGRVLRLVLSLVLAGALGAGYLAWVRNAVSFVPSGSGRPTTILESPAAIVDQARQSADAMSKAAAEQQRELDEIDRKSRAP